MNYEINIASADYAPCYDPSACGNGGGYWQPYGDCTVRLEDGTILRAEYSDTSCGDYGARWEMTITCGAESWYLYEDEIGADAEMQADHAAHNTAVIAALERHFGIYGKRNPSVEADLEYRYDIDAAAMVRQIRRAISDAAREKYWREEEE